MLAKNADKPVGNTALPRIRFIRSDGILTSIEVTLDGDPAVVAHPEVLDKFFGGTFRLERRGYRGRVSDVSVAVRCYIHHADELIKHLLETDALSIQDHLSIAQLVSAGLAITKPTGRLVERYDWLATDFEGGPKIPPEEWHAIVAMTPSIQPVVTEDSIVPSEPAPTVRMPTSPPKDVYREHQSSQSTDRPHPPKKPSPSSPVL